MSRRRNQDWNNPSRRRTTVRIVFLIGILILLGIEGSKPHNWVWLEAFMSPRIDAADELDNLKKVEPLPGLDMTKLAAVDDESRIFTTEADAWNHLTTLLNETPEETLRAHSVGRVLFQQLLTQPEVYRGKLVRSRGVARAVEKVGYLGFEQSVPDMYRVWYAPEESPEEPTIVCVISLPEGFPVGPEISEKIAFTGFFYKTNPYITQADVPRFTPLLLAKTIQWTPRVEVKETPFPVWMILLFSLLMAGLAWTVFETISRRSILHEEQTLPEEFTMPGPPAEAPENDEISSPPENA